MRDVTPFGSNISKHAPRWSTIITWNLSGRWPRILASLSALTILALWSTSRLRSQSPESLPASVADYQAYLRAVEFEGLSQHAYAISELQAVWSAVPQSPLTGQAAVLAARSFLELGQAADAAAVLRKYTKETPQPEGLILLARALEGAGDHAAAAAAHQRVFYEYPLSPEAAESETAIGRLKNQLGDGFPPAMPKAMFERAARLMRAGERYKSCSEYEAIASITAGRDRDLARVRALTGNQALLASLSVESPGADAERLYLLHMAARNANSDIPAGRALEELGRKYPKSSWRLEALRSLGNMYLLRNDTSQYEQAFRTCYMSFPPDSQTAYCHWKVTWNEYLKRSPKATAMLREHVEKYPRSEKRAAALYFLGRHVEVLTAYPMSYYAVLSREKLGSKVPTIQRAAKLKSEPKFEPEPGLRVRAERARALEAAGYGEWAEFELKYAAANEGQPFAAALQLAELSARQGAHGRGLRYIKGIARGYLSIPLESAPERFWQLAFPLPYRESLENHSRTQSLDPFIVAGLVRQESEFDPNAISRARAYGLTQVLPSTGRQLSRTAGIAGFTASMLFDPDTNLRLGTMYLKSLLDQHGGNWPETLAAYNAGKSRVTRWLTWAKYREPAEFIETIPFSETREYVQSVLRNADVYRHLYAAARTAPDGNHVANNKDANR
jgi:soluble lytic murein transglycosylase